MAIPTNLSVAAVSYNGTGIPLVGIVPSGTTQVNVTQNGTTTEDVTNYATLQVIASVPNSYSASDEGKVVNNGSLYTQGSSSVTANDTYDTTLISSFTVNVSGSSGTDYLAQLLTNTLTSYSNNDVTSVITRAFSDATNLTSVSLPNVTTTGQDAFSNTKIEKLVFPKYTGTSNYAFRNMPYLTAIDILGGTQFSQQTFSYDANLKTIVIRKSSAIVAISNANAFNTSTPFASGGSGGTIYIPKALYDHLGDGTSLDYKAATNWSTINGYGTITWAKIEGSAYENAYVDGTPIT